MTRMANGSLDGSLRLGWAQTLAYSAIASATYSMHVPGGDVLPTFYATHTGLPLAAIGTVAMLTRILDALYDPIIGALSDRAGGRFGHRKPFIALGVLIGLPAIYFLMNPPTSASVLYLGIAWACTALAWSLIEIPHMAWGGEISNKYGDRSRLFTFRAFIGMLGVAVVLSLPLLPAFKSQGYTRESFHAMSLLLMAFLLLGGMAALLLAPRGERLSAPGGSPTALFRALKRNAPLRTFLLAQLAYSLGVGMYGPLFALYLSNELRLADQLALLAPVMMTATLVGVLLWLPLLNALGRNRAWALGSALAALPMPAILMISPGPNALMPILAFGAFAGLAQSVAVAAVPALIADIADYDKTLDHTDNSGQFQAAYLLLQGLCQGLGVGVAFSLVGTAGYHVGQTNSSEAVSVFRMVFVLAPFTLFLLASFMLAFMFKLENTRSGRIDRELLAS